MSISKWAYSPNKCDGNYCCGDCDICPKAEEAEDEVREISECKHKKQEKHLDDFDRSGEEWR